MLFYIFSLCNGQRKASWNAIIVFRFYPSRSGAKRQTFKPNARKKGKLFAKGWHFRSSFKWIVIELITRYVLSSSWKYSLFFNYLWVGAHCWALLSTCQQMGQSYIIAKLKYYHGKSQVTPLFKLKIFFIKQPKAWYGEQIEYCF